MPQQQPPGPHSIIPGRIMLRFRRDPLHYLTSLARQYGDVVHFKVAGQHYYLLNNPDYIRDVLVTRASNFLKGPALQRSKGILGEGLLTSEGDFHRRQRKLIQPAFHPKRVEGYAQVMAQCAQDTCRRWQAMAAEPTGTTLDMHAEMMRLALIIAGRTLFGAMMEDEAVKIGHAMHVAVSMFSRALSPWGKLLNRLPLQSNRNFIAAHEQITGTILRIIAERRKSSADTGDLLSILLEAHDDEASGCPMSDPQLMAECYTLLTAGHETTANALTFTWYLLAQHPAAQKRLHDELDAALGDRPPTAADVDALPFTRMVISEAMRLYPPAWTLGREAQEAFDLGPYHLRAKSTVLMSQWVTHRDPQFWPDPEKFLPERWAAEDPNRPRYAYFPFGGGIRQCIGESFAWMEALLLAATLARQFRFELVNETPVQLQPTITLRPRGGMPMRVMVRTR